MNVKIYVPQRGNLTLETTRYFELEDASDSAEIKSILEALAEERNSQIEELSSCHFVWEAWLKNGSLLKASLD